MPDHVLADRLRQPALRLDPLALSALVAASALGALTALSPSGAPRSPAAGVDPIALWLDTGSRKAMAEDTSGPAATAVASTAGAEIRQPPALDQAATSSAATDAEAPSVAAVPGMAAVAGLISMAASEMIYPLARAHYPWKHGVQEFSWRVPIRSMVLNKSYAEEYFRNGADLGARLFHMSSVGKSVLVITDNPLPVMLGIAELSPSVALSIKSVGSRSKLIWKVRTATNEFIMPDTYAYEPKELISESSAYDDSLVLVDPNSYFRTLNGEQFVKPIQMLKLELDKSSVPGSSTDSRRRGQ